MTTMMDTARNTEQLPKTGQTEVRREQNRKRHMKSKNKSELR